MSFTSDDEDLDHILLAGVQSPGVVTLSGHDRSWKWDKKIGDGQSGGSLELKGSELTTFTATFRLVNDPSSDVDEVAAWDGFSRLIRSSVEAKSPTGLDIYHPDLARNQIRSVVEGKIGGMTHDGMGGRQVVVTFEEYSPPKKKSGSPSGSKAASPGGASGGAAGVDGGQFGPPTPDPNQAAKDELAALVEEANAP